jgi:hypothetical protein
LDSLESDHQQIGIGATGELSLRVSVATLVKVMFTNPIDGSRVLALERTATMQEFQGKVEVTVRAKPFGGAVRLINPQRLMRLIGNFHYDSDRSRQESDFRILIRPASWEKVKEICCNHLRKRENGILDSNPERELIEEFEDTLNIDLTGDQYRLNPRGIIIEDLPVDTENVRAIGLPTVRIYYTFEAWFESSDLVMRMAANSKQRTDEDLQEMAWTDAQHGGKGRANAILTLSLDDLTEMYRSLSIDLRSAPIRFKDHQLDGNVLAILEEVDQTRYKRYYI